MQERFVAVIQPIIRKTNCFFARYAYKNRCFTILYALRLKSTTQNRLFHHKKAYKIMFYLFLYASPRFEPFTFSSRRALPGALHPEVSRGMRYQQFVHR